MRSEKCGQSRPENRRDIVIGLEDHAGTVTHVCARPKAHTDIASALEHPEYCQCRCGYQWRAIGGVKK